MLGAMTTQAVFTGPSFTTASAETPAELTPAADREPAPSRPFVQRTWVRLTSGVLAATLVFAGGFGFGWFARGHQGDPRAAQIAAVDGLAGEATPLGVSNATQAPRELWDL